MVSLFDLPATVLEMAGIERPDYYSGRSLFSEKKRSGIFSARDRLDDLPDPRPLMPTADGWYIIHLGDFQALLLYKLEWSED